MSKLTLLLLVLSLIGISKPVKSSEAVVMFALPFLGAIVNQAWDRNKYDHEAEMEALHYSRQNLSYIKPGGCKIVTKQEKNASLHREACKQADGSWKLSEPSYVLKPFEWNIYSE